MSSPRSYLILQEGDRIVITFYTGPNHNGSVLLKMAIKLQDARRIHEDLGAVLTRAGA